MTSEDHNDAGDIGATRTHAHADTSPLTQARKVTAIGLLLGVLAVSTIAEFVISFLGLGADFLQQWPLLVHVVGVSLVLLPLMIGVFWFRQGTAVLIRRLAKREDTELEQIVIRVALVGIIVNVMFIVRPGGIAPAMWAWAFWIIQAGMVISWGILFHYLLYPGRNVPRRLVAMNADLWLQALLLWVGGPLYAPMFFISLWVTLGYGFRYGLKYLKLATVISAAGFFAAIQLSPYWQANIEIAYGLLTALLLIPMYVSKLIRMLTEAKAAAEEASLAKSRFLATVSHELRTPLSSIIGLVGLLKETPLDPEQLSMSRSIKSSARTLLSLINNILDFSKFETGRISVDDHPFDAYSLVSEMQSMFEVQARAKGVRFSAQIDADVPRCLEGDADHIRDLMVNLLGNGLKFTETGKVLLDLAVDNNTAEGCDLLVTISDTGIGIPEDQWDRIFESFSQADETITRRYGGTGLGLTIVKQLVDAMNGDLWLDSEVGRGTTFRMRLPMKHADMLPEADDGPPLAGESFYLISDDHALVEGLREKVIALGGKPVLTSPNRITALVNRRGSATRPMIVYDDRAADLTGIEFAKMVRAQVKRLSPMMVCLTTHGERPAPTFDNLDRHGHFVSIVNHRASEQELANALMASALLASGAAERARRYDDTSEGNRRSLRILVAEDNLVNRRVLGQILESAGHQPTLVENGEEALSALDQENFDLVLMDLNMPQLSGLEATKIYRFANLDKPHLPIIALTADATPEGRRRGSEAGMDDYVIKPIEPADLLRVIDKWARPETVDEALPHEQSATDDDEPKVTRHPSADKSLPPIIDPEAIDSLRALGDDEMFLDSLIDDFLSDTSGVVERLEKAVSNCDARGVRDEAHALRSSAAHFGARRIYQLCLSVSKITDAQLKTDGAEFMSRMKSEFNLVRDELERQRTQNVA